MHAKASNIRKHFWAKAVAPACYLINHSPHTSLKFKSPQEVWYNTPVNYSSLRVFGCPAYIHANDEKLEHRARKCTFVVYEVGIKGYRVWCENSKRTITSRDVVFDEKNMLISSEESPLNNVIVVSIVAQEEI